MHVNHLSYEQQIMYIIFVYDIVSTFQCVPPDGRRKHITCVEDRCRSTQSATRVVEILIITLLIYYYHYR